MNPATRYMRWRREAMMPTAFDTRAGTIAADLAGTVALFLVLGGVFLLAGPDVSVLAGLVILFAALAAWSVAYIMVGALVDVLVWRHRARR